VERVRLTAQELAADVIDYRVRNEKIEADQPDKDVRRQR
jgi:hypothetical protein